MVARVSIWASLHALGTVSTAQNVPRTSPSGERIGKPAHATTPIDSIDGLSIVRSSMPWRRR